MLKQATNIRLAGAALNLTPLDWEGNATLIKKAIAEAQAQNADFLCLPEFCITGYGCEDLFLAPWVEQKAWAVLLEILPFTAGIAVCIGIPYWYENKSYNCAALVADGKILGITAKKYLPKEGLHYEPRWFEAWPSKQVISISRDAHFFPFGDPIYQFKGIKAAIEICEDAWQGPHRPLYYYKSQGVEVILNPNASHFSFNKGIQRLHLAKEAADAGVGYVYVNLLGNEAGRALYAGNVLIAGPQGIIARNRHFSFEETNVLAASLNATPVPIDFQQIKTEQWQFESFEKAVALGLFDYLRKSRSKGFTLSLSGGADSATCATLVYLMVNRAIAELGIEVFNSKLGCSFVNETDAVKNLLYCVYQGSENSSDITLNAAKELSSELGASFAQWNIDLWVKGFQTQVEDTLKTTFSWEKDDLTLQNIQARTRGPAIWMLANALNHLLLTTSNRSEGAVGYVTMDGDSSGSLAPLAGVSKHFIRKWMVWAAQKYSLKSLLLIAQLEPTAELRPLETLQKDETDLMPYELLEAIERNALKIRLSFKENIQALEEQFPHLKDLIPQYLERFYILHSRSQWKRERLAPSFHLDDYSLDSRTWYRFPILSGGLSGFKTNFI